MWRSAIVLWAATLAALAGCDAQVAPEGRNQLLSANQAYLHGDDTAAIAASSDFLRKYEKSHEAAEAYYIRGLARERAKQNDAAQADFASALKLSKRKDLNNKIHFEMGNIAYELGDMNSAKTHYRAVIDDSPQDKPPTDEALYRMGSIMQLEGHWAEADEYFDKVMHYFAGSTLAKRATNRVRAVRWSIQVGAYGSERSGRELAAALRREGFSPREDREMREGQLLRLMRLGSYPTYEAAKPDLLRVQKYRDDSVIIPAR